LNEKLRRRVLRAAEPNQTSLLSIINNNRFELCFESETFNNSLKKTQNCFVAQ